MPWQLNGTFVRENTDYTADPDGRLWGQDLSASIKIIASRHDFHDQDMAVGIQDTLNLDGLNNMRANLKMGGFKITGGAAGFALTDFPLYGQCAGSIDYVDGTSTLTLYDRDGNAIDSTVIATAGGGGSGTVTDITIGDGLYGGTNPIEVSGNISLEIIGTLQTFQGGISAMTVDKHGRVTQVTEGAFANTNLSYSFSTTAITVRSSTGADVVIQPATETRAGVMTGAQVTTLNNLATAGTASNLSAQFFATSVPINNDNGTGVTLLQATDVDAGVMSAQMHIDLYFLYTNTLKVYGDQSASGVKTWNGNAIFNADATFGGNVDISTISGSPLAINTDVDVKGTLDVNGQDALFGVTALPGIVVKGMTIQADGDIFIPDLPTTGLTNQLYNNGDGILRVG